MTNMDKFFNKMLRMALAVTFFFTLTFILNYATETQAFGVSKWEWQPVSAFIIALFLLGGSIVFLFSSKRVQ